MSNQPGSRPANWNSFENEASVKSERTFTSAELALNQAALLREALTIVLKPRICDATKDGPNTFIARILEEMRAIPTDQPAFDRYLAERYITREEHNNIIRMNETVHKRDVAERVQSAYERGVSDGAAARAPIVTKEQLGIVTDDEGNDHWGIQPQPGAPKAGRD
jgi:hypothetical protein